MDADGDAALSGVPLVCGSQSIATGLVVELPLAGLAARCQLGGCKTGLMAGHPGGVSPGIRQLCWAETFSNCLHALCEIVAAQRCDLQPEIGLRGIGFHADALFESLRQLADGFEITLLSSQQVKPQGCSRIRSNAEAGLIEASEAKLGLGISALGSPRDTTWRQN